MSFIQVLVLFLFFQKYNFEGTTSPPDYEESALGPEQNSTITIKPKLIQEFELFNEDVDADFIKWVSLYKFDEDNSFLLEINQKEKVSTPRPFE